MPTPTFEIKKVKNFMGRDCPGYNLELWMDGKLIAYVVNDGGGGETDFTYVNNGKPDFDLSIQKKFENYCESLPPLESEHFPKGLAMDADLFVSTLLERHDNAKRVARAIKTKTLYKTTKNAAGQYMFSNRPFDLDEKALILLHNPGAIIINEIFPDGNWYEVICQGPKA